MERKPLIFLRYACQETATLQDSIKIGCLFNFLNENPELLTIFVRLLVDISGNSGNVLSKFVMYNLHGWKHLIYVVMDASSY